MDTEVDRRLDGLGTNQARTLRGRAAVAQAKLAYRLFRARFSGPRWGRLADRGARVQRPLWASTATKNPDYPDTLYVDSLIGPDTITTMPEHTIAAFEDHGSVVRMVDARVNDAVEVFDRLRAVGVDMADVARRLEEQAVAAFSESHNRLLAGLAAKAAGLARP